MPKFKQKQYADRIKLDLDSRCAEWMRDSLSTRIKRVLVKEGLGTITIGAFASLFRSYQFHNLPGIGAGSIKEAHKFIVDEFGCI